jgi:hypothetical protein
MNTVSKLSAFAKSKTVTLYQSYGLTFYIQIFCLQIVLDFQSTPSALKDSKRNIDRESKHGRGPAKLGREMLVDDFTIFWI